MHRALADGRHPTIAALAGAEMTKNKPLDGLDVWAALEGKPSPRSEIVYNVDPMGAAVRQGDWKPVWKAAFPQRIERFNLSDDKAETA